ncbi:hypothetical protein [Cohnella sp. 56]|uniref:hypothetical protein n=1 Tax=Cohnella sp. 56 TaxID=3113722 RepID=UPI0030E86C53
MSVFRLEAGVHMPIDSRYVGSVEVEIANRGSKDLNMWIQMFAPSGLVNEMLVDVKAGATRRLQTMNTNEQPFTLLMISNTNRYDSTDIILTARRDGGLVAIFNQHHFDRVH